MEYKLSDIFDLQMGKTPSRHNLDYWKNGTLPWISISDLSKCDKLITETSEHITDIAESESGIKLIPENTVVMSFKLSIGKLAITSKPMYSNEAIMAFIDKGIIDINPTYLFYLLSQKDWDRETNKAVMGKTLNKATLLQIKINIHSLREQEEMAKVLEMVRKLIDSRKYQIEEFDNLVKSRFIEMFGDPVINPKSLPVFSLKELCSRITDGTHHSPENIDQGEYLYITAKNIKPDGIDLSKVTYVDEKTHSSIYSRCNPEYGDVLYIKDGVTTGIAAINTLNEPFSMLSSVALLKPDKSKVNSFWLTAALNNSHLYETIRRQMGGAAITRLTLKKIEKLTLPLPELSDQIAFSAFVKQVDKSKLAEPQDKYFWWEILTLL